MHVAIVIPARYASQRLPGKPLVDIKGKPLVEYTYRRATESHRASMVLVATDDARVADVVRGFGGQVRMTSPDLSSGTERVAAAVRDLDVEIVVNLQVDEPLLAGPYLDTLITLLDDHPEVSVATLAAPLRSVDDLANPHVVKVVVDREGHALYFSRAPIPWPAPHGHTTQDVVERVRAEPQLMSRYRRHIGVYAYRKSFLLESVHWPPTPLEQMEQLEQLRYLEYGHTIKVGFVEYQGLAIDTPDDVEALRWLLTSQSG